MANTGEQRKDPAPLEGELDVAVDVTGKESAGTLKGPRGKDGAAKSTPGELTSGKPDTQPSLASFSPGGITYIPLSSVVFDESEKLGSGSFADVFRAEVRGIGAVAVKRFRLTNSRGHTTRALDDLISNFEKEVEIYARITRHPNFCTFLGACVDADPQNALIVTELCERGSVESLIFGENAPPTSLTERARMVLGAAQGLTWLHQSTPKIIHRNLTTGNLLVDKNWVCKIADFNLSVAVDEGELTEGAGTPWYMAPEALESKMHQTSNVDESSDVFSFAIVMWEIFTCKRVADQFQEDNSWPRVTTEREYAIQLRGGRRPMFQGEDGSLPALLQDLIQQCWATSPLDRPGMGRVMEQITLVTPQLELADKLPQRDTRGFWEQYFPGKSTVKLGDLLENMYRDGLMDGQIASAAASSQDAGAALQLECDQSLALLREVLCDIGGIDDVESSEISAEAFGHFGAWFGPMTASLEGSGLLGNLYQITSKPWFFGTYSAEQATATLHGSRNSTPFLVRFASTVGAFALSYFDQDGSIAHRRIFYQYDDEEDHFEQEGVKRRFVVEHDELQTPHASLEDALEAIRQKDGVDLAIEAPGSRYRLAFDRVQSLDQRPTKVIYKDGKHARQHEPISRTPSLPSDASMRIAQVVGYPVLDFDISPPSLRENTYGSITFEGKFEDVNQLSFRLSLIEALVKVLEIEPCQIIRLNLTKGSIRAWFVVATVAAIAGGTYLFHQNAGVPDFWKEPCIPWDIGTIDEEPEYDLFLSHNGVDKADVLILHIAFGALGLKTFLDLASIEGHIEEDIQSGLKSSRHLFAWITKHFFHSPWACREIWSFLKSRGVASVISYAVGVPVDEKEDGNIRTLGPRVDSDQIKGLEKSHSEMALGYAALYQRIHKSVDVLNTEALRDVLDPFLEGHLTHEQAEFLLILARGCISLWDEKHSGELGKVPKHKIESAVEDSKVSFRARFPDAHRRSKKE